MNDKEQSNNNLLSLIPKYPTAMTHSLWIWPTFPKQSEARR
jgi:hypothetical protein